MKGRHGRQMGGLLPFLEKGAAQTKVQPCGQSMLQVIMRDL